LTYAALLPHSSHDPARSCRAFAREDAEPMGIAGAVSLDGDCATYDVTSWDGAKSAALRIVAGEPRRTTAADSRKMAN